MLREALMKERAESALAARVCHDQQNTCFVIPVFFLLPMPSTPPPALTGGIFFTGDERVWRSIYATLQARFDRVERCRALSFFRGAATIIPATSPEYRHFAEPTSRVYRSNPHRVDTRMPCLNDKEVPEEKTA